jgi:translation initiation factor 3 subunit C
MAKYQEKTPEQELMEKRRQMPFHMHITLELVESVYLISAMLLEVPNMAANPLNPKKKMISKSFHRVLDTYNRQMFTGPPENVRDHVMAATKALMRGDWAKSYQYLTALSVWNLMPQKTNVLTMLKTKLQVCHLLLLALLSFHCFFRNAADLRFVFVCSDQHDICF